MKDLIRKILKEDLEYYSFKDNKIGVKEGENQFDNYMFFQNLKEIKENIEELLSMDPSEVDGILSDGHDWASEHMATAKDDIEEVTSFLKHRKGGLDEGKKKKDDRCTRIAKRKYDVWPSAYASGAVVRCRKGEIWKDEK